MTTGDLEQWSWSAIEELLTAMDQTLTAINGGAKPEVAGQAFAAAYGHITATMMSPGETMVDVNKLYTLVFNLAFTGLKGLKEAAVAQGVSTQQVIRAFAAFNALPLDQRISAIQEHGRNT